MKGRWWGKRRGRPDRKSEEAGGLPAWAACFGEAARLARFEGLVRAYFADRGIEAALDDGYVNIADDSCRYGLTNLAQACMLAQEREWAALIAAHFDAATDSRARQAQADELLQDFGAVRDRLVLRMWSTEDVRSMGIEFVAEERAPGLSCVLMLDGDDAAVTIPAEKAAAWGVPTGELIDLALENVAVLEAETRPTSLAAGDSGRLLMAYQGSSIYGAAMALRIGELAGMTGPHGALVSVPVRNVVFSVPIASAAFVSEIGPLINLTRYAVQAGPGPVSDRLWWVSEGRWLGLPYRLAGKQVEFSPPEEFNAMVAGLAGEG